MTYSNSRRTFLRNSSLALAATTLLPHSLLAQSSPATLKLGTGAPIAQIPADFIGLSYEAMQLEDPTFFSPANKGLIAEFRHLSPRGVLRLGGNTSEFGWWKATPSSQPPTIAPPARQITASLPPTTIFAITPEAIRNLDGFLKATGWTCIYGLNLGFAVEAADVAEADFVAKTLGPRLQYFQLGNEVDIFNRHLRDPKTWGVDQYLKEWVPSRARRPEGRPRRQIRHARRRLGRPLAPKDRRPLALAPRQAQRHHALAPLLLGRPAGQPQRQHRAAYEPAPAVASKAELTRAGRREDGNSPTA